MAAFVRVSCALVLVGFLALTAVCFVTEGLMGFPHAIAKNLTSLQVFLDLVLAALFWAAWAYRDARDHGGNGWLWVALALGTASIAALIYGVAYGRWPGSPKERARAADGSGSAQRHRPLGWIGVLALAGLTIAAVAVDGPDVPATVTSSWCGIQIWVDLVILIVFWCGWLVADVRARGTRPWGWLVYAAVLGSFAPLTYLALHGRSPASHPAT